MITADEPAVARTGRLDYVSRRAALQLFSSSFLAALIPLAGDLQNDQLPVADKFQLPMEGELLLTSTHLELVPSRISQSGNSYHIGIDLNIGQGDDDLGHPVTMIASGKCVLASSSDACGLGNIAIFEHRLPSNEFIYSRYAHLDQLAVFNGAVYEIGQIVGAVGRSGCQGSAHLHLDVANELAWKQSLSPDPRWYPQRAPRWWLERRFLDPLRLFELT